MEEQLKDFLNRILIESSPSGSEEQVTNLFKNFVSPFVDEVYTDANGNCIAHKKGIGPKVMLMAHADEVGLMINYIDKDGFLYFKEIGGIDTNILPSQRVWIHSAKGPVLGVIGRKPIHLQDKSEGARELNSEDLWIDLCVSNKAQALESVQIGDVATIISEPVVMPNETIVSRALDDKVGLAVLAGVAQNLYDTKADVYLVASVQEELGARGAQMVSEYVKPDIGIAIDVTHATDYPTMNPIKDGDISLEKGAVIPLGPNMHKEVCRQLVSIAQENEIPVQIEAIAKPTGTDAREIQVSGCGIKTGLISIPCRYMHTPNEMVSLKDAESAIKLLTEYLKTSVN